MATTIQNAIQPLSQLYENLGFHPYSRRPIGRIRTLTHNWRRQYMTPSGIPGTQLLEWDQDEHDLVEMATKYLETDRNGMVHWPSNNRDNPGFPPAPRYPQDEAIIKGFLSQIFWHQNKNQRQSRPRYETKDEDSSESVIELSSSTSSNYSTYDRSLKRKRTGVSSGKSERSFTPLDLQGTFNYRLMQNYSEVDAAAGVLEPTKPIGESPPMTAGATTRASKRKEPSVDPNHGGPYSRIRSKSGPSSGVDKYFEKRRSRPVIRNHQAPPSSPDHPGQPRPSLEGQFPKTREEQRTSVESKSSAQRPGPKMSPRRSSTSPASTHRPANDSSANPPSPGLRGHTTSGSNLREANKPTEEKPAHHIFYTIIIHRKTRSSRVSWMDGKIADRTVNEFFAAVGDQIQMPHVERMNFRMSGRHIDHETCVDRNDERAFKNMQRSWRRSIKGEMRKTPPNFEFEVDLEVDLTMASEDEDLEEDSDMGL